MTVIQQWFISLHDIVDRLIVRYPEAAAEERSRMEEQWKIVKTLSDELVENWLRLEDKLAVFQELQQTGDLSAEPETLLGTYEKGQGYFKLQMYRHAADQLEETVRQYPDLMAARLYLAMSRMHLKEWNDAQRHLRLIAALAEDRKLQAIAYNALGCIQAVFAQLEQAQQYFRQAVEADPTFSDAQRNLECCRKGGGELHLQFGSAALYSMA